MNREQLQFIRSVLDLYFSDQYIDPETVLTLESNVTVMDFPRSLYCDCKRCTSPWVVKSIAGTTITLTTTMGVYYAYLPGNAQSFEYEW